MKNIAHLLDVIDGVRDHVALGLMSDPGLSKTSQVKQWAESKGRRYCELIISQRMPSEISGMPMPVQETQRMEIFDFQTLLELEDGDVLAFDEFTNGNIQTLNACLTLIQERTMLSGKKLPSLVVVAMGNPQGKCDLLPQTKQRFLWVDVKWDSKTWCNYMGRTWGLIPHSNLVKFITTQYQEGFGDAAKYNYLTPRTVENLLRIAMKVSKDDPFWDTVEFDYDVVNALYLTLEKTDNFRVIQKQLIDWVVSQPGDIVFPWQALIEQGLEDCETMGELRRFIDNIEKEGLAPEFIEYTKTHNGTGESDG